jgi:osmotically inducible lipoprotein OsmB
MLLVIGACGQTTEERAATGGLGGVATDGLGGPVGAGVGDAAGATGGAVLDEGVDDKVDNTADETPDATTDGEAQCADCDRQAPPHDAAPPEGPRRGTRV